jgi:class 3 adenylate cyclase/tetratricopeptide (TPR) repeat protein
MTFEDIVDQAIAMLQRRGRVTYRMLKRQFDLDEAALDDLTLELIKGQRLAVDEDGDVLVWAGDTGSVSPSAASVPAAATARMLPPITYTPRYLTEKILTSRSALEGERKQVTVLFADIKDSTELIKDLDPEAAQQLLDPAIHIMMDAVHRFEGTVNQVLGDGIMALFGAPLAHEDHAARACYAALAMQTAMQPYADEVRRAHGMSLRLRVGLNSGEVVVRTIGNDLHMDYSAVGHTTHLASRMEQLAAPGSITLTAATLRLVEGLVRVHALGPVPVKGMTEPVEVYELTGASAIRRRLQAAVARGLTRFVGRDAEIAALTQVCERAAAGHGQVVAEAGVGKSRLVYEFVHSHHTQGWLVLESASVSYGKATPYFPVIDLLKRYMHVEDGDEPRTIRAKVTGQIMTLDDTLQDTIPAVLSLLDALPEDSPFVHLDPPQRRQRTLDGLKRLLLRESQVQPLLVVFEDLHWIDSETQTLLDSLIESVPTAPLVLLVNYRPEYQHGWGSKTYYTQLRLDPLPPASADALLAALLGNDPSLEPLKKLLIARTEGNPFFLEESVRTLVETQVLVGASGAYRLGQELPTIQVPATVQAILAARIDRLPQDEKRLLQTAAVIGTEVPLTLLDAIAEMPEEVFYRGLTHLQAAEFLYETSLFPERVYTFKHALTHEVAYGSLLQERRRALHASIVVAIERLYADRLTEEADRLAHHAFRSAVWEKAFTYCQQAAAKAADRSAHREAVGLYDQALQALDQLAEQRDIRHDALDIRISLRHSLLALGDYDRMLTRLRESEALAETLGEQEKIAWVASAMSTAYWLRGKYDQALAASQRALSLAVALDDIPLRVAEQYHLGQIYNAMGDYPQAIDCLTKNVASLAGHRHRVRVLGTRSDFDVLSRAWLARCLAEVGEFRSGRSYGEEAVRITDPVEEPFSLVIATWGIGLICLRQGQYDTVCSVLESGLETCHNRQLSSLLPWVASPLGAVYLLGGRIADALPLLEQAVHAADTLGAMADQSLRLAWLSEAWLLAGHPEKALDLARQACDVSRDYGERGNTAWTLHLLGGIAMHRNPRDMEQAETHYQQALTLATELGMRPLQAHCHRGLGTLYRHTGQSEPARAELSTALDLYRDMAMTFWLP